MSAPLREPMILLADENVPASVVNYLRERGHRVTLYTELFALVTPDPVIAHLGGQQGLTVVTWNFSDFKGKTADLPEAESIGRIIMRCPEPRAIERLDVCLPSIEFEYASAKATEPFRFHVEVGEHYFKVMK